MSRPVVAYADGVFDLTHYGHHRLLAEAKKFGDVLIVGVHLDSDVEKYKRKPIMTYRERTENLRSLGFIDSLIEGPLIISEEFMSRYKIDVVVHAHTTEEEDRYEEMYRVPHSLGKFKRLDYTSEISTTDIIRRIKERLS